MLPATKLTGLFCLSATLGGCAVYYHDPATGADHIWGFGHLAMKAQDPADGKQAVIQQSTLTGVAVGVSDGEPGFSVGWDRRERIHIYDENTALSIERPGGDYFLFKIGAYPPSLPAKEPSPSNGQQDKTP